MTPSVSVLMGYDCVIFQLLFPFDRLKMKGCEDQKKMYKALNLLRNIHFLGI